MKLSKFFLVLIFLLFPFGQLTKIPLGTPGVSLYLQDLVIGLLFLWWLFYHFLKRKPFLRPPLIKPILAFISVAFFSLVVNLGHLGNLEVLISFLYLLRWGTYTGVYFIVYEITEDRRPKTEDRLLKLLMMTGVTTAVFGLIQYILYPNLRNLYYLGWDPHQYRVFGTFLDPGFTGIVLVLTLILLLCWEPSSRHPEGRSDEGSQKGFFASLKMTAKLLLRAFWGLLVYSALLLTYSRSSYLALVAAMLILAWLKRSARFLFGLFFLFFFVVTISFLPRPTGEGVKLERTSTVAARLENYRQSFKIIKDHPLFGVGFNSLRFVKRDYGFLEDKDWREVHSGAGADSSLLFVWATTGVIGLLTYLWMWWRAIQNLKLKIKNAKLHCKIKKYKFLSVILNLIQNPELNSGFQAKSGMTRNVELFNILILVSIVALFVHSLFLNSLFYPWVMVWMWVLLGISHSRFREKE